ncbi:MAG: Mur ligase family protein [Chromatiales bacterium]|nr:Mur ligase family protein [Chromatiales bacterium]
MKIFTQIKLVLKWRAQALWGRSLVALAYFNRRRLKNTVFVGITGSVGKTTTKDLAVLILSRAGHTCGNKYSLNYLVDIAQAIISMRSAERFAVLEVPIIEPGSIDASLALVQPSIAVMTVIGRDHIKNFGSIEAIAEEKSKIIMSLPNDGIVALNIDDPLIRAVGRKVNVHCIWFGSAPEADLRLLQATSTYPDSLRLLVEYEGRKYCCVTNLHGKHLSVSVLAAMSIGIAAGLPIEECISALEDVRTTPGRMQIVQKSDGVTYIRDDYKAPHWSFQAALNYLREAKSERKIAVIGTLSDYSLSASKLYPKVARQALDAADLVLFVGPHAFRALKAKASDDNRLFGFTEIEDANHFLQNELRSGDLVLLKGSNRADHLVRLLIARNQPVTCWSRDCGLNRFCDACPKLYLPKKSTLSENHLNLTANLNARFAEGNVEKSFLNTILEIPANDESSTWLIVGLGNSGEQYSGTPHNIGFETLDFFAQQLAVEWSIDAEGMLSLIEISGKRVILFKPNSEINLIGYFRRSCSATLGGTHRSNNSCSRRY